MFGRDSTSLGSLRELFNGPPDAVAWLDGLVNGSTAFDEDTREGSCARNDGREFPVEFGIKPLVHENQTHYVCFVRDITRRKHEEEKRRALEQELSQAQKFEALGTLASGVAHEINTPIQYVSDNLRFLTETLSDLEGLTGLCRDALGAEDVDVKSLRDEFSQQAAEIDLEFVTEEAPRAASQSLEGLEQVASIVKAIKAFAHPGDDAMVATDLNEAIATTLTVARNRWKYVAEVETDFGDALTDIPCHVGDMNQVFVNLIVNAADAIDEVDRDGLGTIKIQTRRLDDVAEIRISDNGCGIPEDAMERIFDPFFTTKDVGKGSGQGLAISYNIVRQKHLGTIACESKQGKGTTFVIRLPARQTQADQEL